MQRVAPVVLGNRLDPLGLVVFKIFGCQAATVFRGKLFQRLRHFAAVESRAFSLRNRPQTFCCGLELKQLTHPGRPAPRQKGAGKSGLRLQLLGCGRPLLLHHRGHQITAFGNLDGRLHQVSKRQLAKALAHAYPTADRAGNRDRIQPAFRRRRGTVAVLAPEVIRRPALRCAA